MVGFAEAETAWPLIGLIIGVLVAAAIAYGMYAGAVRINLAKFFTYTGVFLILVAAGILSYGIGALQTVGWLPGLDTGVRHHSGSTGRPGTASHPGHLQHHARPRPCCSSLLARLPRRRTHPLPAPHRKPGQAERLRARLASTELRFDPRIRAFHHSERSPT